MSALAKAEAELKVARAEAAVLVARAEAAVLLARAEATMLLAQAGLPPITESDAVVTRVKNSEQAKQKQWELEEERRELEAKWDEEDCNWRLYQ